MKFYIGAAVLVASMMTMGCEEMMGRPAQPAAAQLSSAELLKPALMLDENPYGPAEKPAPMVSEDPWAPDPTPASPAATWGQSSAEAVDYGF
jgi:hypothetical protein